MQAEFEIYFGGIVRLESQVDSSWWRDLKKYGLCGLLSKPSQGFELGHTISKIKFELE